MALCGESVPRVCAVDDEYHADCLGHTKHTPLTHAYLLHRFLVQGGWLHVQRPPALVHLMGEQLLQRLRSPQQKKCISVYTVLELCDKAEAGDFWFVDGLGRRLEAEEQWWDIARMAGVFIHFNHQESFIGRHHPGLSTRDVMDNAIVLHGLSLNVSHVFLTCDYKWHSCASIPTLWC